MARRRGWACEVCTLFNEEWRSICIVCGEYKGKSGAESSATCTHTNDINKELPAGLSDKPCAACGVKGRNLVCLNCHVTLCGREERSHMAEHQGRTRHGMAMALDTRTAWCYECNRFVQSPILDQLAVDLKKQEEGPAPALAPAPAVPAAPAAERGLTVGGPGIKGLDNLGNSCFFNSVMQCLLKTSALRRYFAGDAPADEGSLTDAFRTLFRDAWAEGAPSLRPRTLFDEIRKRSPQFEGYHQQDAQELLHVLLHQLEVEEVRRYWNEHGERPKKRSYMKQTFLGCVTSTLRCHKCQREYLRDEWHLDISVRIPGAPDDATRDKSHDLAACLTSFTDGEVIEGVECPRCSKGGVHPNATKTLSLRDTPDVLVVHVARFLQTYDGFVKDARQLVFPTELDLEPYLHPGARSAARGLPQQYTLYAVVEHMGRLGGGHYVAYARDSDENWRRYSDSSVRLVTADDVMDAEPYLLFYGRASAEVEAPARTADVAASATRRSRIGCRQQ